MDDETREALQTLAAAAAGQALGLEIAIRALQAQPGYDHAAFVRFVGAFQAAGEGASADERVLQRCAEMLDRLCEPPVRVPPIPGTAPRR